MTEVQGLGESNNQQIYQGQRLKVGSLPSAEEQRQHLERIPPPPPWRTFGYSVADWEAQSQPQDQADTLQLASEQTDVPSLSSIDPRALGFVASSMAIQLVNVALCLRRPILIEGKPGSGKTSLAYAVALELGLPGPYRWSIVSRTTLKEGLYSYDAIGRLQSASLLQHQSDPNNPPPAPDIGEYLRLGPMGMAFHLSTPRRPAVLLIDEIDKSDIDMPNDLLHIFEEGFFEIPELKRLKGREQDVLPYRNRKGDSDDPVKIIDGCIQCKEFPLVFMTSNEAREFPPAFLRRCLRLTLKQPADEAAFYEILSERFGPSQLDLLEEPARKLIRDFLGRMQQQNVTLATDQLLNAVYLLLQGRELTQEQLDVIYRSL